MVNSSDLTVVCCIEAGALEQMTVRMIASLRRFGGKYAQVPVLAVTPRRGLPLSTHTRNELERFAVKHISFVADEPYRWNNFMNKPHALVAAEKRAVTSILCWLDSDILVVNEPTKLAEFTGDFTACAPDKNVGSTGPEDENDAFWQQVLEVFAIEPDTLPWVTTCVEQASIRWYFNSGVFSFRRGAGFAEAFLQDCRTLLAARIASRNAGIFFTDQIAMGLTAHRLGYRFDMLPHAYNLALGSKATLPDTRLVNDSVILHYHDALWPAHWEETLTLLRQHRPDVHEFLTPFGPLVSPRSLPERISMKMLQLLRKRRLKQHLSECTVV